MIKPSYWTHRMHSVISESAAILAVALLNYADDEGRFEADPDLIEKTLFPRRDLATGVEQCLQELEKVTFIHTYEAKLDGLPVSLAIIPKFSDHQTINKPRKSTLPAPVQPVKNTDSAPLPDDYGSPTTPLPDVSRSATESLPPKVKESKGKERNTPLPPEGEKVEGSSSSSEKNESPEATTSPDLPKKPAPPAAVNTAAREVEVPGEKDISAYCATAGIPEAYATHWFERYYDSRRHRDWKRKLGFSWKDFGDSWTRQQKARATAAGEDTQASDKTRARLVSQLESAEAALAATSDPEEHKRYTERAADLRKKLEAMEGGA